MVFLYIALGLIALFLIVCFVLAKISHDKFFNYHYEADPDIPLYTAEEFNVSKDKVEFKDGKNTLRGYLYHKGDYDDKKIIIYAHGMFSNHNAYMQDICYFAERGYLVLGFNYLGVSDSDGKNLKAFGSSIEGVDAAINYVKSQDDLKDKDIYVVGHSWGCFATCNIVKFHPEIKGIAALAPFVSVYKIVRCSLPKAIRFITPMVTLIDFVCGGKYSRCNSIKSLNGYKGKALLIQSTDDLVVNYDKAGVGLIKNKATNKNIIYQIEENKGHQPHYTLDGIKLMHEYEAKARTLSGENLKNYKHSCDFHKMGELDSRVMDLIINKIIEG